MDVNSVELALGRLKELEDSSFFKDLKEGDSSYIKYRIQPAKEILEEMESFLRSQGSLENVEALLDRER